HAPSYWKNLVPQVGSSRRFSIRWPFGRFETSCFSNCGQFPPEITATLATSSSPASSIAISSSSADLLSASVPSRSNTISFFKIHSTFGAVPSLILNQSFFFLSVISLAGPRFCGTLLRHVERTNSRADYGGAAAHGPAVPARGPEPGTSAHRQPG